MRPSRKDVELVAISLFAGALEARGIPPIHAPDVTDRPDALFFIGDRAIAIECRYLSHPTLVSLLAPNSWPANRVFEVFLPVEPHLWVRDAIVAKAGSVPGYLARSGAEAAWLLLHSSHQHEILRDDRRPGTEFFELLRLGARLAMHPFEEVWVAEVGSSSPTAVCIFGPATERPEVAFDNYRAKHAAYPLDHFWFSNAMVTSSGDANKRISVNLNDLVAEPVCIQPIDDNWKIDYDSILADPNRNANLKNLTWKFWDERPRY